MSIQETIAVLKKGKFKSDASYEATRTLLMIQLTERAISKHNSPSEDYLRNQLKKLQDEYLTLLGKTKKVDKRGKRK